jgi:ribosome-associated translation inhibitor RaiA
MKITMKHRHHYPSESLTALVRSRIGGLSRHRQIDEAIVLLERRPDASPAFRVLVLLVTPGPDITTEAVDHTLRAAFGKALADLEAQIARRIEKQTLRKAGPARTGPPVRNVVNRHCA